MNARHHLVFAMVVAIGLVSSLLLIPGRPQTALLYFKGWRYERAARIYEARLASGDLSVDVVAPLAELYLERGQTDRAVALLERLPPRPDRDRAIADFYKSAQRPEDYLRTIERFDHRQMPEELLRELCDLYRDRGRYADLVAALKIVTEKYPTQAGDFVELANLEGAEGELAAAAATMARLERSLPRSISGDTLELHVDLLLAQGDVHQASERATVWLAAHHDPQLATRLAELLAAKGQPALALQLLGPYRRDAGRHAQLARVLAALATSQARPVTVAKAMPPAGVEARPVVEPPAEPEKPPTAAELLAKLRAGVKDDAERLDVIYGLLDLNARSEALPTLAELAHRKGGELVDLFVDTATQANRKPELARFLTEELERRDLPEKSREDRLQVLLDCCPETSALPWLREFALRSPGSDWASAYEEALTKLGRQADLISFLESLAARADIPAERRREIAFQLLESGAKKPAEETFLSLARNAAPESPDVDELLFIWGPRPRADALDWLEARARASRGADRARWLKHLADSGAADRVARLMASSPSAAGQDAATADAWLAALEKAGKHSEFGALIMREARTETAPDRLRKLAQMARDAGQSEASHVAYERLLAKSPADADALRTLGMLAYGAGRYAAARDYLARYFKTGDGDPETNLAFGEMLARAGDRGALDYFRRGLAQSEKSPDSFELRVQRAQLLNRVGRRKEALAEFRKLVTERPSDKSIRADYAELLLAQGSYREAQRIASAR